MIYFNVESPKSFFLLLLLRQSRDVKMERNRFQLTIRICLTADNNSFLCPLATAGAEFRLCVEKESTAGDDLAFFFREPSSLFVEQIARRKLFATLPALIRLFTKILDGKIKWKFEKKNFYLKAALARAQTYASAAVQVKLHTSVAPWESGSRIAKCPRALPPFSDNAHFSSVFIQLKLWQVSPRWASFVDLFSSFKYSHGDTIALLIHCITSRDTIESLFHDYQRTDYRFIKKLSHIEIPRSIQIAFRALEFSIKNYIHEIFYSF